MIKGRWEKTLGVWAGRIGKGIGIVLQVAVVAWEWHQAGKAQAAHEAALAAQQQQIAADCHALVRDCERELNQNIAGLLDEVLAPLETNLLAERSRHQGLQVELGQDMERVQKMRNELGRLRESVHAS